MARPLNDRFVTKPVEMELIADGEGDVPEVDMEWWDEHVAAVQAAIDREDEVQAAIDAANKPRKPD